MRSLSDVAFFRCPLAGRLAPLSAVKGGDTPDRGTNDEDDAPEEVSLDRALARAGLLAALARLALVATAAAYLVVLLLHEVAAALVYAIAAMLAWLSF